MIDNVFIVYSWHRINRYETDANLNEHVKEKRSVKDMYKIFNIKTSYKKLYKSFKNNSKQHFYDIES